MGTSSLPRAGGRPPGPIHHTPRGPGWHGCEDEIAWLLRVNRLHGADNRLANGKAFAAAFRGRDWPTPTSASQISRWETATTKAGFGVLRRYEQVLGLPDRQLIAAADWTYRKAVAHPGSPVLDRGLNPEDIQVHDRTDQLLEQALSTQLMTSAAWDELTAHLAVLPVAFLHPRTAWSELTERLLAELLIADGLAWLSRAEALGRLMALPRARASIIAACGCLAADPTNLVVVEPMTILDQTPDRDASRHILGQLRHPTSDQTLRGALRASVDKLTRRHFRPTELHSVAAVAIDLLTEPDLDAEARNLAAALLRVAPRTELGSARARLRGVIDPTTNAVLTYGRTMLPHPAGHIIDRLTAATVLRLPRPPPTADDPILSRLLDELLFSPNVNDTVHAGQLLAATPYREPLGAALAAELATAARAGATPFTTALVEAMPWVGRPADRRLVECFVRAPGPPTRVADVAAWRIGHIAGHSTDRFWYDAVRAHHQAWQRARDPRHLSTLRGLIYSLGIAGHHTLLASLRDDHDLPAPARAAATWWLNIPTHIHTSAAS